MERICESLFWCIFPCLNYSRGDQPYPPSPSLPMDLSLRWIATNNRVSSAHLELQRFSQTYKTHMTTLGARGLQLRNGNEERACTTTVRMSAADGSEQGKSDRATVFEKSKRLLAKQKELLQQVNPASFPFLFSKSQRVCFLSARAFRSELEHRFFVFLFIQTCVQLFFWWRSRRFSLFCGSVFRSDCAIGMRHYFSCTFYLVTFFLEQLFSVCFHFSIAHASLLVDAFQISIETSFPFPNQICHLISYFEPDVCVFFCMRK